MTALAIAALFLLVLLNGLFVAAEFALVRSRRSRLEALAKEGEADVNAVLEQLGKIDEVLSACQLGITVASIGIGFLGEPAIATLIEPLLGDLPEAASTGISVALAFAIATTLHITIGEQVPKMLAITRPEATAQVLVAPGELVPDRERPVHLRPEQALERDPARLRRSPRRHRGEAHGDGPEGDHPGLRRSSTPARPGCSAASSTCTSRRFAR